MEQYTVKRGTVCCAGGKMENKISKLTKEQAETQLECFQTLFTNARLLTEEQIKKGYICSQEDRDNKLFLNPGDDEIYLDGIEFTALNEKKQIGKLDLVGDDIYQVIAKYVEVDGKACIIEMMKPLDKNAIFSLNGKDELISKLAGNNEEVYKDSLTGTFNRRYFEDTLKNNLFSGGVAMIDIDDFKIYNDMQGHDAGDAVLKAAVAAIKEAIRSTDSLIRYNGDEFLLIMPGVENEENFKRKLKEIKRKIQRTDVSDYSSINLSASIGGIIIDKEPLQNGVIRADKLMYTAKNYKNTVITDKEKQDDDAEDKLNILIVDDSELNREILSSMLGGGFNVLEADCGEKCIQMLEQYGTGISIILLDIVMPGISGFDVLNYMNDNHLIDDIPVIMISSDNSADSVREAYEMGVSDFISRPFDAKVVHHRVFNTIKLYSKQRRLLMMLTDQINEKERNNDMMIGILSQIVEFRNGESGLHVVHIRTLTEMLLEQLVKKTDKYKLDINTRHLITTASALHDIGKMGIDDKILNKPGRLTNEEFEIMKTHTVIGADMLEKLEQYKNEELIKIAHTICRWHHERYDGRGYPDGLKGDEIPIAAQVVSVADVYDALVSERVYKKAFSHEKAIEMILGGECGTFNPELLECMLDIQDSIKKKFGS